MEVKNETTVRRIMYVVILAVASLPLACGYIMQGGEISLWIARIEEVKEHLQIGQLLWFPSAELTVAYNGQFCALNSNVWLFIPAFIRFFGVSITASYQIYMLLLNVIALLAVKKMFEEIFEKKTTALLGILLYMTCPYRLYIYYDKANLGMAAAWSLIPFVIWGMIKIFRSLGNRKNIMVTALAFAAVGYADGMLLFILTGIILLGILWYKKWQGIIPIVLGGTFFLPGIIYWLRYLLKGDMEVWNFPLRSISSEGYVLGQFFSSWVYRNNCPGLGLGLLIGLFVLLWFCFTQNGLFPKKKYSFCVFILFLLAFMSTMYFPWDLIQRLGVPFLRLISLIETPAVCFGFASLAACILSAFGAECTKQQEKLFIKIGLPMTMAFAAVGVFVYMCNMLMYFRVPLLL